MHPRFLVSSLMGLGLACSTLGLAQGSYSGYQAMDEKINHVIEKSLVVQNLSSKPWTFGLKAAAQGDDYPGKIDVNFYDPSKEKLITQTSLAGKGGTVTIDPALGKVPSVLILTPVPDKDWKYWLSRMVGKDKRLPFNRDCYLTDNSGNTVDFRLQRNGSGDKTPTFTWLGNSEPRALKVMELKTPTPDDNNLILTIKTTPLPQP